MDKIALGKVASPHGVRGRMKVKSLSGNMEHFLKLKEVYLRKGDREKTLEVELVEIKGPVIFMKFKGIDSPEEGKLFSSWELWADRSFAQPLERGEYYFSDLCGCSVFAGKDSYGTVRNVCEGGNGFLLEVEQDGKTLFVPFLDRFIRKVDIKGKKIEFKVDWFFK